MSLQHNTIINIYSIILLIIVYFHSAKSEDKKLMQNKIFFSILRMNALLLFIDILSRFDGNYGKIYTVLNYVGNFLIFSLNPAIPLLWFLYAHLQIFNNEEKIKKMIPYCFGFLIVNFIFLIFSVINNWYYYIDANNIYHRGKFFIIPAAISFIIVLFTFGLIIFNRKKVDKKCFITLFLFSITPILAVIAQSFIYGVSIILNFVVISVILVYLNIQQKNLYTDYLTGINNRKKLELHLKKKISTSTKGKTFSAIMIDLDNFKLINDTFGHDMGDAALKISAQLLSSCLRSNDFISRVGGDEFCIVLDTSNLLDLQTITHRINSKVRSYNESCEQPYILSFSMGYSIYDFDEHMSLVEFQKHIDTLMYKNKRANKDSQQKAFVDTRVH